jgi:hypothetical protein
MIPSGHLAVVERGIAFLPASAMQEADANEFSRHARLNCNSLDRFRFPPQRIDPHAIFAIARAARQNALARPAN